MPRQHFLGESEAFATFPKAPDPGRGRSCDTVRPPEVLWATSAGAGRPRTSLCPLPASGLACSRFRPQSRVPQPPGSPPRPPQGLLGRALVAAACSGQLSLTKKPKAGIGGRSLPGLGRHWAPCDVDFISCLPVTGCSLRAPSHIFVTRKGIKISFQISSCFVHSLDQMQIATSSGRRGDLT